MNKCTIAYSTEDLLFDKFILKLKINMGHDKIYYANRIIDNKKKFRKEEFNSIVALSCLKALLSDIDMFLPKLDGEEANKKVILVAYKYGYLTKKIKLEYFDPSDDKVQDSIVSKGYDFADKHDINYNDIYMMNLGCYRKGYIEKKIGLNNEIIATVEDIDQYYGKEPSDETLVCSLV